MKGREDLLKELPVMSLGPMMILYIGAMGADKILFTDEFIEYEFSPISLRINKPANLHDEFLKAIETDFAEQEEGEDPSALQVIIDENLVNGFLGQFLKIDKMYSLRDLLNLDPRLQVMKQLLTTTTVGMVVPSFKEEYGENRALDVVLTSSHEFMASGLGDSLTPTGLTIEANGNFAITANLGAQLIVQDERNVYQEARAMYVTLQLKGKMFVADPEYDNRTFVVLPKNVQMTNFKVLSKDGEEQFLEQMLVQSMVGFQLENLKKLFQPLAIGLKKVNNPPELQCLGFNLTNLMVKVNKGFLQLNGNYVRVPRDESNAEYCREVEERLNQNPQELFNKIAGSPIIEKLTKGADLLNQAAETGKTKEEL